MSKKTAIWLITAFFLVLIGCMIFGGAMTMFKWDFSKLSTVKYETNTYEISDSYKNISIITDTADIVFAISNGSEHSVVCHEAKKEKHSVTVIDGALVIKVNDTRKWYEYIGIAFSTPKITVYLPKGEYGALTIKSTTGNIQIPKELSFDSIDISESTGNVANYASASDAVKIKTSTGNITVENISAKKMDLAVTTGKITVSHAACEDDVKINVSTEKTTITKTTCKNLVSNGNTGSILLNDVVATGKFSIKRSTGAVKFENADASEIFVETDTGNVSGSLLTDKVFITHTDTGKVDVPKTVSGGRCEITTDTGDIRIKIQ